MKRALRKTSTVRRKLLLRDGRKCQLCQQPLPKKITGNNTHIDHIVPWSKEGGHSLHNLRLSHKKCNLKRGNFVDQDEASEIEESCCLGEIDTIVTWYTLPPEAHK